MSYDFQSGQNFCNAIEEIVDYIEFCEGEKNKYKKLLEEYSKDEELIKKDKIIERLHKNSLLQMSDLETQKEKEFREIHYKSCKNGNRFQYEIVGTGIGNCISIKCPICNKEEDITDTSCW